jgi:hypothetical protein
MLTTSPANTALASASARSARGGGVQRQAEAQSGNKATRPKTTRAIERRPVSSRIEFITRSMPYATECREDRFPEVCPWVLGEGAPAVATVHDVVVPRAVRWGGERAKEGVGADDASDGAFLLAGGAGALGRPTAPPVKDYAYRNGKVIIGEDVIVPCRSFFDTEEKRDFYPEAARGEAQAQAERALEQCEQAGHVTLPGTGGGTLPLLAAGLLVVCADLGLVAIHRTS